MKKLLWFKSMQLQDMNAIFYWVAELVHVVSVLGLQLRTRPVRAITTRLVSSAALPLDVSVLAISRVNATGAILVSVE